MDLIINSTPVGLWHKIIHDAEQSCAITLEEELESYLVFLLMRFMNKPEFANRIAAIDVLRGMQLNAKQRLLALQEAGDTCLLFAGLYPQMASKRLVRISYFIHLGQASYITISNKDNDLYSLLSNHFVSLMDVLQSIRQYSNHYPDLLPLDAYELWNDTGSQRALNVLRQYTQATPFNIK